MFDLEYNTNVGFVPYVSVMKSKKSASEEEMEKTQQDVQELSGSVTENAEAISDETAAREAAVEELNERIDEIPTFDTEVVDELPAEGKPGTIYLLKDEGKDTYSEYLYADGKWEKLGNDVDFSDYVKKEEFDETVESLAEKADAEELADNVYTKDEADSKFLTEHQDISDLATKDELAGKADADSVYTKAEADEKFLTEHQDVSEFVTKDELAEAVASLAVKEAVDELVNQEAAARADGDATAIAAVGAVTSALEGEVNAREAADEEIRSEIAAIPQFKILVVDELPAEGNENALYLMLLTGNTYAEYVYVNGEWCEIGTLDDTYAKIEDVDALSGAIETLNYEFDSVDEKLAGLANVNAEQDAIIATLASDLKKLKEIVGDMGGAVEYSVPGEGKLTDLLKKSGTVKLTEDVESATYTGGLTSKNVTTLNTNGKTITFTGTTVNNPGIMTRGAERLTIVGKGTIDGNGRIAIETNGADSVVNLSGSTGFFGAEPTYVTDRSGGELIYCYLGTINIYAGVFKNEGENKTFMLNCYDANYRSGKATINVMGGKFYDFDPANNAAEGEGTSFVPEGYESVHTTEEIDGVVHDVYTVKKSA